MVANNDDRLNFAFYLIIVEILMCRSMSAVVSRSRTKAPFCYNIATIPVRRGHWSVNRAINRTFVDSHVTSHIPKDRSISPDHTATGHMSSYQSVTALLPGIQVDYSLVRVE